MTTSFVSALNRGGLQLPSSVLHSYVETAFLCFSVFRNKDPSNYVAIEDSHLPST